MRDSPKYLNAVENGREDSYPFTPGEGSRAERDFNDEVQEKITNLLKALNSRRANYKLPKQPDELDLVTELLRNPGPLAQMILYFIIFS